MCETPKTNKESMWAESGTGDEFQCVHIDDAKEMELLLRESIEVLRCYSNNDVLGVGGDMMIEKINKYLNT